MKQSTPVKTFDSLFAELSERAVTRPEGSGTVAALDAGVHAQGKKVILVRVETSPATLFASFITENSVENML